MALTGTVVALMAVGITGAGSRPLHQQHSDVIDPLVEQTKLTARDGAEGDGLRRWVAIAGETLVVGANLKNIGANIVQGAAYVFERVGGVWTDSEPGAIRRSGTGQLRDFGGARRRDSSWSLVGT